MDDSLKALQSWINARLSAPLARSIAASVLALTCVAILIHTLEGYDWRYVFQSEWFLGATTVASLVSLFVAWRNRWILNSVSKFVAVPVMIILAVACFQMAWRSTQFVYNPLGIFEQRKWQHDVARNRWIWRLCASSDTSLKFEVRVNSNCDHVDIINLYPVPQGPVSPSLSEVSFQSPRSRTWEIDQFRRPAVVEFSLELNDDHADANRCVARDLRM